MKNAEANRSQNSNEASSAGWPGTWRTKVPVLFYGLVFLVLAELVMIFAAPLVLPEYLYLRMYLGETARASTIRFLSGRDEFLKFDSVLGWRSMPNANRGKWQTDSWGSRSSHAFTVERTTPTRVLFLGNSVTNGGMNVTAKETISAYIEDSVTESLNFATMLYSLDQDYLSYISSLYAYNANVVVVGLQGSPNRGLENRYVPFLNRDEVNMPFLKPRFTLGDTGLNLIPLPPKSSCDQILEANEILDSLQVTDAYFREFSAYKHFGLTPISCGVWRLYGKVHNLVQLLSSEERLLPVADSLLTRMTQAARNHNASTIFMMLPERTMVFRSRWRSMLPDHYAQMVIELKKMGYTILDGAAAFRNSGLAPSRLYSDDGVHFSAEGNKILAQELKTILRSGAGN